MNVKNREPIHDALVNYVVLTLAQLLEGTSWWFALIHFKTIKGLLVGQ